MSTLAKLRNVIREEIRKELKFRNEASIQHKSNNTMALMPMLEDDGNSEITPEIVSNLYKDYSNKNHFLSLFGTSKFKLANAKQLEKMYQFLIKRQKNK